MLKFTSGVSKNVLHVFVEIDEDGEAVIKVSNGSTTAEIAYFTAKGELGLFKYVSNAENMKRLGLVVNGSQIQTF